MKRTKIQKQKPIIFQAKSGAIELRGDFSRETIWANLNDIASVFGVQKAAVSKHIKNIFETNELNPRATVSKMETVQQEGNRKISRSIEYYNLDMIIAVGYRVNSKMATNFRIWATKILKKYVTEGFTVNKAIIAKNYAQFLSAVEDVKKLLPVGTTINADEVLELISLFADTWLSLDAYDKDALPSAGATRKNVALTAEKLSASLAELKKVLIKKGEASDLFGNERSAGNVAGIVGNVMQAFGGQELYPTVEDKAAHLLYFMVKNHP
ncbi:MAG: RhuM family protein, partial [Patescibacteria group bacterium]